MGQCPLSLKVGEIPHRPVNSVEYSQALEKEIDRLKAKLEARDEILHKIKTWCEAYPLEVFPKPDLKKAAEVLSANGMTLDSINADNVRHVLEGIKDIMKGGEK